MEELESTFIENATDETDLQRRILIRAEEELEKQTASLEAKRLEKVNKKILYEYLLLQRL